MLQYLVTTEINTQAYALSPNITAGSPGPIPSRKGRGSVASSPGLRRKGGGLVHTTGVLVRMRNDFRIFYVKYFV